MTTNTERREALQDLYVNTAHPMHSAIYALQAAAREDDRVSPALQATLSTLCATVSAFTDALHAVTELMDEQAAR